MRVENEVLGGWRLCDCVLIWSWGSAEGQVRWVSDGKFGERKAAKYGMSGLEFSLFRRSIN